MCLQICRPPVYVRTSQEGLRCASTVSAGSGSQKFVKPNSSPVGMYLMTPSACPKGEAGCSHRHTGSCEEAGQSVRVAAVLFLW